MYGGNRLLAKSKSKTKLVNDAEVERNQRLEGIRNEMKALKVDAAFVDPSQIGSVPTAPLQPGVKPDPASVPDTPIQPKLVFQYNDLEPFRRKIDKEKYTLLTYPNIFQDKRYGTLVQAIAEGTGEQKNMYSCVYRDAKSNIIKERTYNVGALIAVDEDAKNLIRAKSLVFSDDQIEKFQKHAEQKGFVPTKETNAFTVGKDKRLARVFGLKSDGTCWCVFKDGTKWSMGEVASKNLVAINDGARDFAEKHGLST